jgi:hypothetical protein
MPGSLPQTLHYRRNAIAVPARWVPLSITIGDVAMSKGMDQKKNQKKQPAKTPQEKRAAKQEKKNAKK